MGKLSLSFLLSCVLPSPLSLSFSPSPQFLIFPAAFTECIQQSHLPYLPYMPSPSLLIHNAPPQLYFPSTPTRMAIIAEEHSLNLKISMSLSLCSCRGTSPKAALRYGWPCLFASSGGPFTHSQHTPQNNTHTLSKGHSKAVITSILQLCYYRYPPSSQSGLGPFLWVHSSENGAQKPSSNKVPSPIT